MSVIFTKIQNSQLLENIEFQKGSIPLNYSTLFQKIKTDIIIDPFSDVFLTGAGRSIMNGTYVYISELDGKPYYTKGIEGNLFVVYLDSAWSIFDFSVDTVNPIYYSVENKQFPWEVTNWISFSTIYDPVPVVTYI